MGSLNVFSEATRAWFEGTFAAPTPAQEKGWPVIATGSHTLIQAPTGSGKTLAAFLYAIDRLTSEPRGEASQSDTPRGRRHGPSSVHHVGAPGAGLRVLYVSPLKALNYDVERN